MVVLLQRCQPRLDHLQQAAVAAKRSAHFASAGRVAHVLTDASTRSRALHLEHHTSRTANFKQMREQHSRAMPGGMAAHAPACAQPGPPPPCARTPCGCAATACPPSCLLANPLPRVCATPPWSVPGSREERSVSEEHRGQVGGRRRGGACRLGLSRTWFALLFALDTLRPTTVWPLVPPGRSEKRGA